MFKIGDVVEITAEAAATGMLDFKEDVGYKVRDFRVTPCGEFQVFMRSEGFQYDWYHCTHFKLKEDLKTSSAPEFTVGDVVICVETDFFELDVNNITYLKEYTVKHSNSGCIQIVKDSGELGWFNSNKFKLKEDTKVEKKECLFKVGQIVWDLRNGRGVVEEIINYARYPVKVKFDLKDRDGDAVIDVFTEDGRYTLAQTTRSLYFSEPKIEAAAEPLFEPTLKSGDVVIAIDNNGEPTSLMLTVTEEVDHFVKTYEFGIMNKKRWSFYRLGEKITFK